MAEFSGAKIGDELWKSTANSVILDSGSSANHIPTKEYNILLNVIVRDHECKTVMNPLETYYCKCSGADDPTFPLLKLRSGAIRMKFRPKDYLVYESIAPNEPPQCMVSFQENSNSEANSFWLLGDTFLRAFYTIYDGENKRIGIVGDTEVIPDDELKLLELENLQAEN